MTIGKTTEIKAFGGIGYRRCLFLFHGYSLGKFKLSLNTGKFQKCQIK